MQLLATTLTFASGAAAYINSMSAPASVQRGQAFTAQLNSSIYVQNYDDFGVVWGLAPPNLNTSACVGCVGRRIGYTNLFGDKADVQVPPSGTVGVQVTVPADQAPGEYLLIAGASYLVGVSFFHPLHPWSQANACLSILVLTCFLRRLRGSLGSIILILQFRSASNGALMFHI